MCELVDNMKLSNIVDEAEMRLKDISEDKYWLKTAVQQAINKLKELPKLLESNEYTLVFMGKPGCGKTSTITSLCNLVTEEVYNADKKCILKDKASILPVGSGGTTMQETIEIIKSDSGNYIEVECRSRNALIETVRDIVEKNYFLELKNHIPDDEKLDFEISNIPREIERYIEGMCKKALNREAGEQSDKRKKLDQLIKEKSKQLIESGSCNDILLEERISENVDNIVDYIMSELIVLDSRCSDIDDYKVRIDIDAADLKNDLRNKMSEINDGKMEGLSIIYSVKIYLEDTDFFPANEKYAINKIVDTRGYRGSKDGKKGEGIRSDYQKYLSNDAVNTICIFETNYKDCSGGNSSDISEIIEYNVNASYRDGLNAILINWQTGEVGENRDNLEDMEDEDDISEEELVGKRIGQMQSYYYLQSVHKGNGINFNSSNIFAYNALAGYKVEVPDGKTRMFITRYDRTKVENSRKQLMKDIFSMVDRERENINRKISENYNILRRFIDYGDIRADAVKEKIIKELYDKCENFIQLVCQELDSMEFYRIYCEKLKSFHSRAYKPLAVHSGEYWGCEFVSVSDIDNEMYEFYSRHIKRLNGLLTKELDSVKNKLEGVEDTEGIRRILENIKETAIESLDSYSEDIEGNFKSIIMDNAYFGKLSKVWDRAKERAAEGGRGVNADIKDILLDSVDPAKKLKASLYGSFSDQCRSAQDDINEHLKNIVDESFGM